MQTDSSARRTYLASRSASEWTTTVLIPISRHARWMRNAISPRLAIRILSNSLSAALAAAALERATKRFGSGDDEQRLSELDRLPVLREDRLDDAGLVGLDLVHELHRLDDAQRGAFLHRVADLDERLGAGRGRPVESAHHRAFHQVTVRSAWRRVGGQGRAGGRRDGWRGRELLH